MKVQLTEEKARKAFDEMLAGDLKDKALIWPRYVVEPLRSDAQQMPSESCGAFSLPRGSTYAHGAREVEVIIELGERDWHWRP